MDAHSDYQAYLIRFQRSQGQVSWRVTLENILTGKIEQFGCDYPPEEVLAQIKPLPKLAEDTASLPKPGSEDLS